MIYYLSVSLSLIIGGSIVALHYYYQNIYKRFQSILAIDNFKDTPEVREPVTLTVESGRIPEWLSGVMYRVGPGRFNLQQKNGAILSLRHAFDGLPFMHRFHINGTNQTVTYKSRVLFKAAQTSVERDNKKNFSPVFFGHLPEVSFTEWLKHVISRFCMLVLFSVEKSDMAPDSQSVGVTATPVFPLPSKFLNEVGTEDILVSKTDANILQKIHAETLEPQRLFDYADYDSRLTGQFSAAHHQYDPTTKEVFNFSLSIQPQSKLIVFKISPDGQTSILSTITHHFGKNQQQRTRFEAAYIHSFWLTKNYIIIPESPLAIRDKGMNMLLTGSFLSSMAWDVNRPTYCHVIRRYPVDGENGLIATIPINNSFFTFHTGNAYESTCPSTGEIMLTLESASFANGDIMHQLHMYGIPQLKRPCASTDNPSICENLLNGIAYPPRRQTCFGDFVQYQLNLTKGIVHRIDVLAENVEFPRFNQQRSMLMHRYVYGCQLHGYTDKEDETCGLIKINVQKPRASTFNSNSLIYAQKGYLCSEPIFVPRPSATDEDDGVILSLMNHVDCCYLIILNALTMQEIARIKIGQFTAVTFHGSYVDHDFQPININ